MDNARRDSAACDEPDEMLLHYFDELLHEEADEGAPINTPPCLDEDLNTIEPQVKHDDVVLPPKQAYQYESVRTPPSTKIAYGDKDDEEKKSLALAAEKKRQLESLLQQSTLFNLQNKKHGEMESLLNKGEPKSCSDDSSSGVVDTQTFTDNESLTDTQTQSDIQTALPSKKNSEITPSSSDQELPPSEVSQAVFQDEWQDNGRPVWAQADFEALTFFVSGLRLAVPLVALGKIQAIETSLKPVFGQADWFMGLLVHHEEAIKTVNTALFVMPERYDPSFVEKANFVMTINGIAWGLAIDKVDKIVNLKTDEVNWRGARSRRPWLAGTVKTQMCALLDVAALGRLFAQSERVKAG